MRCNSCGNENPEDAAFCVNCASRLRCPNCNGLMVVGRLRSDYLADMESMALRQFFWYPDDLALGSEPVGARDVSLRGSLCRHCRTVVVRY